MTDNELTHAIIVAAIEAHQNLGPGLLESTHEKCLTHELLVRNLRCERQEAIQIANKLTKLKCGCRIDLLVECKIVVELKSVEGFAPIHEAIVLTSLRLSGHKVGLLINFNVPTLKDRIRRFML
jgi:GxxExxY protein